MQTTTQTRGREHFGLVADSPQELYKKDKGGLNGSKRLWSGHPDQSHSVPHFEATVMSGSSSGEFPVANKKIGEIRRLLKSVLNISSDAVAILNGGVVTEDAVINARDRVEFVRKAGNKGSC